MRIIIHCLALCVFSLCCHHFYVLFDAERDHTRFVLTGDKKYLESALKKDPTSTMFLTTASKAFPPSWGDRYIQAAIATFNGDITACGIYYTAAVIAGASGDIMKVQDNLNVSLYYNPNFEPTIDAMKQVEEQLEKQLEK